MAVRTEILKKSTHFHVVWLIANHHQDLCTLMMVYSGPYAISLIARREIRSSTRDSPTWHSPTGIHYCFNQRKKIVLRNQLLRISENAGAFRENLNQIIQSTLVIFFLFFFVNRQKIDHLRHIRSREYKLAILHQINYEVYETTKPNNSFNTRNKLIMRHKQRKKRKNSLREAQPHVGGETRTLDQLN